MARLEIHLQRLGAAVARGLDEAGRRIDRARRADRDEQVGIAAAPRRSGPCRRASRRTRRCPGRTCPVAPQAGHSAPSPIGPVPGEALVAGEAPAASSARRACGAAASTPARSCRSSTFWVTISSSPGHSASSRASALCAALGSTVAELRPPRVVECVNQRRIAPKGLGRGDILDAVAFPQAIGAAEGGEAAFGRYAGAGQDDDIVLTMTYPRSVTHRLP